MNKLIFIEGVSGVGKTTAATLICDNLKRLGYNAHCYLEGERDNPLDPFEGSYPPAMPLSKFSETYLQRWRGFAESRQREEVVHILDGTLFHHQINDLIREYNAADDTIINHLSELLSIIRQIDFKIIYLLSADVGRCLREARKNRDQHAPTDEEIAFWENRKRIDLYTLEKLDVESYILNIDIDRSRIADIVTEHIIA